jgi:hypothetical protein
LIKLSEEAGLQILGPDDGAIQKVRVIASTVSALIITLASVGLDSKPSTFFFFLTLLTNCLLLEDEKHKMERSIKKI